MEDLHFIRDLTATAASATITAMVSSRSTKCAAVNLPAGGVISMPNGDIFTLTAAAAFKPSCTPVSPPAIIANGGGATGVSIDETSTSDSQPQFSDFRDHFYASTFPQCYALAATTVIAYTLVIMLFITPRSFLDGGVVVLGRKGFTNGSTGTNIGGRPWLQKVAALTVAISLTIATADTFRVAAEQYSFGIENAETLQEEVLGGTELKVIRIISDTFLWLAQAQTLIRLFPRQREKVIIKWTAFALIILDLIFQSLNSFVYTSQGETRSRNFTDAVPALSYLFELSLGVLYAAWVIYYSLMKKRYAYYHPQMRNMCLVAALSLIAILVPVVFFVLDISKPDFTGWGDYVRWVGAAAASVIVWEWVERIEALEREEKKDGILGREVFDGDEMLEITPSDFSWPRKRKNKSPKDIDAGESGRGGSTQGAATGAGSFWPSVSSLATRYRSRSRPREERQPGKPATTQSSNNDRIRFLQPPLWPSRPQPAVTPISRSDTASAASTVYAVRYHPLTETTSRTTPPPGQEQSTISRSTSAASSRHSNNPGSGALEPVVHHAAVPDDSSSGNRWRALAMGLKFPRVGLADTQERRSHNEDTSRWDLRSRLEEFAVTQAERLRERVRPTPDTDSLPVTVVPAPPRRGAALAQVLEEEQLESVRSTSQSNLSRTLPVGDEPSPTALLRWTSNGSSNASDRRHSPVITQGAFGHRNLPSVTIAAPPRRESTSNETRPSPAAPGRQAADEASPDDRSMS